MEVATHVNTISQFISCEQISNLANIEPVEYLVLCFSSVLLSCETVFEIIVQRPELARTVVLCGGIGHSTVHIYDAVAKHERFKEVHEEIQDLSEGRVLDTIFRRFYAPRIQEKPLPKFLIEEKSTNCAMNAVETKKLLEDQNLPVPKDMVIVQDPTMMRRTLECFKKVYSEVPSPPTLRACPVFVPMVKTQPDGNLAYTTPSLPADQMWSMDRFLQLVMGEIPRMRDDAHGYGPNGTGNLLHIDIPEEVEAAYSVLAVVISHRRPR